jgi:hypothetical protein
MRSDTGRAGSISAVDAIVAAHAAMATDPVVLTGDASDLTTLAAVSPAPIAVVPV